MATGEIQFGPWDGTPGDGSANNAGPALLAMIGSESNPKKVIRYAAFDASTDEHLWFQFRCPVNYASGGTVKLLWMANATANACGWGAAIGAITPADADTPVEHAKATAATASTSVNATEARRLIETSLDISSNLDSVAPGDLCFLLVYRDGDGSQVTDSLTVDAELIGVALQYTTT